MDLVGLAVATAAALAASAVYYGIVPPADLAEPVPQRSTRALLLVEGLRNVAVAALLAGLLATADWDGLAAGALVGLALGVLPIVLFAGSVFHEGVAMRQASVHSVDWLIKLVVIGAVTGLFI